MKADFVPLYRGLTLRPFGDGVSSCFKVYPLTIWFDTLGQPHSTLPILLGMHPLMESLTGAYTEEYTLYAACKPFIRRVWTYEDESMFLNDLERLDDTIHLMEGNWVVENCSLGMTIVFKNEITFATYIMGKRKQIKGEENESEEE